jgi:hypothetical protein
VDWKLIFQLSMFGLAMGIATVFVIPSSIEPIFWLVIFVICAVIVAKQRVGKPFLHGLLVSLVNSVWITAAHGLLFDTYVANHARETAMMQGSPVPPRLMMLLTGPIIGLLSGLVLGLFAVVASKAIKPTATSELSHSPIDHAPLARRREQVPPSQSPAPSRLCRQIKPRSAWTRYKRCPSLPCSPRPTATPLPTTIPSA